MVVYRLILVYWGKNFYYGIYSELIVISVIDGYCFIYCNNK